MANYAMIVTLLPLGEETVIPEAVRICARATVKMSAWTTGSITVSGGWRGGFGPRP